MAALADGVPFPGAWLSGPDVIGLVADAVELAAAGGAGHPWLPGIMAIDPESCPGVRELLQARAAEGSGRSDEARLLIGSCLRVAPGHVPPVRDAMEYELGAGNWARAYELASSLGDDDAVAGPLLRPLKQLREPVRGAERAGRNQPCPCGSGRKYKVCCRAKDLECGTHPLTLRAPAMYAMLATYAQRAPGRQVADRLSACAIGAPHAAMLALDLAIFDGGIAGNFLATRGHLLRPDERELLEDWLSLPVDMYEVSRVSRGSEVTLRSLVGGPTRLPQRDRLFSMSVRRLDVVLGRLLPTVTCCPMAGSPCGCSAVWQYWTAVGGRAPRSCSPDGPARPGADPGFPPRLVSQFAPQSRSAFKTADEDEYRFCETTIDVAAARHVWDRLTRPCIPAPEPPVRDLAGDDAYVAGLPSRFWTQNSDTEIEYVGRVDTNRLTNLGTVERTRWGFKVTANSVRRAAAPYRCCDRCRCRRGPCRQGHQPAGEDRGRNARQEQLGWRAGRPRGDVPPLGLGAALTAVPPRELILEEHFLPVEHSAAGEAVVREINRELGIRSMLAARTYGGRTAAEAVAAGGAARDRVLAMIDDCEWLLARTEAEDGDTSFMPLPDELRRRVGLTRLALSRSGKPSAGV